MILSASEILKTKLSTVSRPSSSFGTSELSLDGVNQHNVIDWFFRISWPAIGLPLSVNGGLTSFSPNTNLLIISCDSFAKSEQEEEEDWDDRKRRLSFRRHFPSSSAAAFLWSFLGLCSCLRRRRRRRLRLAASASIAAGVRCIDRPTAAPGKDPRPMGSSWGAASLLQTINRVANDRLPIRASIVADNFLVLVSKESEIW